MRPKRNQTNYIVVHCSATKASQDMVGADTIDIWHKNRGWQGIGYHIVIKRNGVVQFGEPIDNRGAHVKGHNYESVGVCLVGGLDENGKAENNFTKRQFESLEVVLISLASKYPEAEILGHRDLSPDQNNDGVIESWEWIKECPCFDVREWLNRV